MVEGRLKLTPFLTGLLGLVITRHLAYGPVAVLLAVDGSLLVIAALRSPIVPALSAGLLPFVIPDPPLTFLPFTLADSLWLPLVVALQKALAGPDGGGGKAAGTAATETA